MCAYHLALTMLASPRLVFFLLLLLYTSLYLYFLQIQPASGSIEVSGRNVHGNTVIKTFSKIFRDLYSVAIYKVLC